MTAAADRPAGRGVGGVQIAIEDHGALRLAGGHGHLPGLGLDRAAAHGAPELPRRIDHGPRPGPLRRRSLGRQDQQAGQPAPPSRNSTIVP